MSADPGLPQPDQRFPLVPQPAGSDPENLAAAEFHLVPHDPISRPGVPIMRIEIVLDFEERGDNWTARRPRLQDGTGDCR